jgi:predicted nucleic acid-binding protein
MYLFDTSAFELLLNGEENTVRRIATATESIWLSSVAAEEMLSGRLSAINRARSSRTSLSLPLAHQDFAKALEDIRLFPLLVYSAEAESVFRSLSASVKRIGSQDCRIAAQAVAHGFIVVTCNIRDFEAISAPCEDWSRHLA